MKLRFCNCEQCRYGRKHYGNPDMITHKKRNARHLAKTVMKTGDIEAIEELPVAISIPYTD